MLIIWIKEKGLENGIWELIICKSLLSYICERRSIGNGIGGIGNYDR